MARALPWFEEHERSYILELGTEFSWQSSMSSPLWLDDVERDETIHLHTREFLAFRDFSLHLLTSVALLPQFSDHCQLSARLRSKVPMWHRARWQCPNGNEEKVRWKDWNENSPSSTMMLNASMRHFIIYMKSAIHIIHSRSSTIILHNDPP